MSTDFSQCTTGTGADAFDHIFKGVLFVAVAQRRNSSAVARASCPKSVALPSALPACVALRWTAVTSLTVLLVYTGSVATLPSRYSLERNDFMSPLVPPTTRREARRIRNCIFQKMTTGRVHCNSRRLFCFHFRGITPSNGLFGTLSKEFLWVLENKRTSKIQLRLLALAEETATNSTSKRIALTLLQQSNQPDPLPLPTTAPQR